MKPQRVLVVILKDDYGIPQRGPSYEYNYFYKTFKELCPEVELFDFGSYLKNTEKLQTDIQVAADRFKPDLIFFTLYQNQFSPATIDALSKKYLTVNWFCDDQWRFEDFSKVYAPHFRYVVTTDPFALPKYKAIGCEHVVLSQWAAGETPSALPSNNTYRYDVTFVGGVNPYRKWLVSQLVARGVAIQTFGAGWKNGRVEYDQMNSIFQTSKVNLNISNSKSYDLRFVLSSWENFKSFRTTPKNRDQVKGRHFEIAASGGFQLTNYVEFLEDYFVIGKEIAVYNTIDDLVEKIRFYLADDKRRQSIAVAGFQRSKNEHTYRKRFLDLFDRMYGA